MACKYCEQRGKTWSGDDPRCAFDPNGFFRGDNWNCATMNELRKIAVETAMFLRDDGSAGSGGLILADDAYGPETYEGPGGYIALGWYKQRGRTGTAVFIHEGEPTTPITFDQAEMAIRTHEQAF